MWRNGPVAPRTWKMAGASKPCVVTGTCDGRSGKIPFSWSRRHRIQDGPQHRGVRWIRRGKPTDDTPLPDFAQLHHRVEPHRRNLPEYGFERSEERRVVET